MIRALMHRSTPPQLADPAPFLRSGSAAQRFAAAALIGLAGGEHDEGGLSSTILSSDDPTAKFFARQLDQVDAELASSGDQLRHLEDAAGAASIADGTAAFDAIWAVLFPEGVGLLEDWDGAVDRLRRKRRIEVTATNADPIVDPVREVLFTSNVLVSPGEAAGPADYWYDHPIPLDARPEDTELAYGLRHLDAAIGFELDRHPEWQGPATVALSLSATHRGYEQAGRDLVGRVVGAIGPLHNLRVYAFEENRTQHLWNQLCDRQDEEPVFGVAGLYGRHYSFLKAIAALWSVVDDRIRATFKIDLDQVFPQEELVAETGKSALEHLTTDRWGGRAFSAAGEELDLAMIAGGLVNQSDIGRGLFTPDVTPGEPQSSEDVVFYSRLPQALSTVAEIVVADSDPLERVHVTGGTNGILVAGLRKWRPFTPSVFGRAEDQAYIISTLGGGSRPAYLHAPGLIMRHDKGDLIPDVIAQSALSKHIGDLVRTRLFSAYGAEHKSLLDPFTGCFVSRLPIAVSILRLCLRVLDLDATSADRYLAEASRRLDAADRLAAELHDVVASERAEWDLFYDALDALEVDLETGSPQASATAHELRRIINDARFSQ
jgi:hypothetical protein